MHACIDKGCKTKAMERNLNAKLIYYWGLVQEISEKCCFVEQQCSLTTCMTWLNQSFDQFLPINCKNNNNNNNNPNWIFQNISMFIAWIIAFLWKPRTDLIHKKLCQNEHYVWGFGLIARELTSIACWLLANTLLMYSYFTSWVWKHKAN